MKKNGYLGVIDTNHVSDKAGDKLFFASQPIYQKYKPGGEHDDNFRLSRAAELKAYEVDEKLFHPCFLPSLPARCSLFCKRIRSTTEYLFADFIHGARPASEIFGRNKKTYPKRFWR